jgi:hypothetical protein
MGPAPGKKTLCVSPRGWAAWPSRHGGPYDGPTFCTQMSQRDLFVFRSIILPESRYWHAGVCYRSSFPHSTRNSQFLSFLSPKFELVPFPHLHPAVIFSFSLVPRVGFAPKSLEKGMASLHLRLASEEEVMFICF